jgi:hypothetical protein
VADLKKEVSESFGVLSPDGIALRGLFIIDREGVVQHSTINNLSFGRSVDETLRVLQALQHVQVRRRRRSRRGGRIGGRIGGRERERELKKLGKKRVKKKTHVFFFFQNPNSNQPTKTGQPRRGLPRRLDARSCDDEADAR